MATPAGSPGGARQGRNASRSVQEDRPRPRVNASLLWCRFKRWTQYESVEKVVSKQPVLQYVRSRAWD